MHVLAFILYVMGSLRVARQHEILPVARFMDAKMQYTRYPDKLRMCELTGIRPEVGETPHEGGRGAFRRHKL